MTTILFRKSHDSAEEFDAASKYFSVTEHRTECHNQLIIGRYSVLPFYKLLEEDLAINGCNLINSYKEHRWIADFDWYFDFEEHTPRSWFQHEWWASQYNGQTVVKGRTNSKKHRWNKQFFAQNRSEANRIAYELSDDPLISEQGLVFREYIPLKTFGVSEICGTRWSNEWRFFCLKDKVLCGGYYWSSAEPEIVEAANAAGIPKGALELASACAIIANEHCNFYVLDVAETESGEWILIEINDAQMAGLSEIEPDVFYRSLANANSQNSQRGTSKDGK